MGLRLTTESAAQLRELRDQWNDAKLYESNCLRRLLDKVEDLCESEAFNEACYDRNWSIEYVSIEEDGVVLRGNYDDEHIEIPFR